MHSDDWSNGFALGCLTGVLFAFAAVGIYLIIEHSRFWRDMD